MPPTISPAQISMVKVLEYWASELAGWLKES